MRVTFEDNVKNIVSQKKVSVSESSQFGIREDHIKRLKEEHAKEQDRRRSNQNLAQIFLGVGNELMAFKSYGLEATHRFPVRNDASVESADLALVSAGMRRTYLVVPSFSVGLYLSEGKVQELSRAKMLSVLSSEVKLDTHGANSSKDVDTAGEGLFLALKIVFARPESAQALGEMFTSALVGARNAEYLRALEDFSSALLHQVGATGMRKKDSLVFLFQGQEWLGVAANGQTPDYIQNAHLRRRLMNAFAGENPIASELPDVLQKTISS